MVKSGFVTMEVINKRKRSVEKIIGERSALKDARADGAHPKRT